MPATSISRRELAVVARYDSMFSITHRTRLHAYPEWGASRLKELLARCTAQCLITLLYCLLPLLPLLATMAFMRWRFVRHYPNTLRKMRVHLKAMRQGPMQHFFRDVLGRAPTVPAQIRGSCVQCGNCCMERRCAFLEQVDNDRYQCGIYNSVWRRFSNCGSYPLNQHDIDRYACPGYYAVSGPAATHVAETLPAALWAPVHFVPRRPNSLALAARDVDSRLTRVP
jgi:hypothetical protein